MTPAGKICFTDETGPYLFTEGQIPWDHTGENGD